MPPNKEDIEKALHELEYQTRRLQSASHSIVLLTLLHLMIPIAGAIFVTFAPKFLDLSDRAVGQTEPILLVCDAGILFLTLFSLYRFDLLRKKGDLFFFEISDEIEWNASGRALRGRSAGKGKTSNESDSDLEVRKIPGLDFRITLREFIFAKDLPLAPGAFGIPFYFLINTAISFFIYYYFFKVQAFFS